AGGEHGDRDAVAGADDEIGAGKTAGAVVGEEPERVLAAGGEEVERERGSAGADGERAGAPVVAAAARDGGVAVWAALQEERVVPGGGDGAEQRERVGPGGVGLGRVGEVLQARLVGD